MCVSSNASLFTFIFSIISSFILIYYGNKKYSKENLATGLIFIYVSLMQMVDYFIWNDLDNKKNYNKSSTIFGAFLNYTQPTIIYLVKSLIFHKTNSIINLINLIYFTYFIYAYNIFLNSNELITHVSNKHLYWAWTKYFNFFIYIITLIINCYIFINFKYFVMLIAFIIGCLILSYFKFKEHVGQFWCFIVAYTPILICLSTYFF